MCIRDSLEEQRNTSTVLESQVFYALARPRGDELFYYGVDGEQDLDTGEEEAVLVPETVLSLSAVSYTHLRAHETSLHLVCRLLLEKKNSFKCCRN